MPRARSSPFHLLFPPEPILPTNPDIQQKHRFRRLRRHPVENQKVPRAGVQQISPRPILLIAGENAHSRYFSEDAYKAAAEPKELMIIRNANHVDLYDRMDKIPFDKISEFFNKNMK